MIKTAQEAYLAGRQAALEKVASDGSNTALNVAALAAIPTLGAYLGSKYNPDFKGRYHRAGTDLYFHDDYIKTLKDKVKSQGERLIQAKERAKNLSRNTVYKGSVDLERRILQNRESSLSRAEKSRTRLVNKLLSARKDYKGKGFMDILRRNKGTAMGLGLGTALAGGLYLAGIPDEPEQERQRV